MKEENRKKAQREGVKSIKVGKKKKEEKKGRERRKENLTFYTVAEQVLFLGLDPFITPFFIKTIHRKQNNQVFVFVLLIP